MHRFWVILLTYKSSRFQSAGFDPWLSCITGKHVNTMVLGCSWIFKTIAVAKFKALLVAAWIWFPAAIPIFIFKRVDRALWLCHSDWEFGDHNWLWLLHPMSGRCFWFSLGLGLVESSMIWDITWSVWVPFIPANLPSNPNTSHHSSDLLISGFPSFC